MKDTVDYELGPVTRAEKAERRANALQARNFELTEALRELRTSACGVSSTLAHWDDLERSIENADVILGLKTPTSPQA